MRREWTLQLRREHEDICYQYRISMEVPLIEITNHRSYWGQWDPLYRKIALSEHLVKNHSWDVVIQILKHEMAHQLVSDIFHLNQSDHGEAFQKACELLGVAPEFRKAGGDLPRDLPSWQELQSQGKKHELLQKAEKLFSLAESSNEHEAVLAMRKAHELLAKYNLKRMRQENSEYHYLIINFKKKTISAYQSRICSLLSEHYFVKPVFSEQYDATACETYKIVELLGTKENLLMAEYVYHFLTSTLERMWLNYKRHHQNLGRKKRSYLIGLLDGFATKLMQMKSDSVAASPLPPEEKALVQIENQRLQTYLGQRFPRLSRRRGSRLRVDTDTYCQGKQDGREIVISKGITKHEGGSPFLLGHS